MGMNRKSSWDERLERETEERKIKEEREEEYKKKKRFDNDLRNQRAFYSELIERVRNGKLGSQQARKFENVGINDFQGMAKLDDDLFQFAEERFSLSERLRQARISKGKEELGKKVADEILGKETLSSRIQDMSPREMEQWEKKMSKLETTQKKPNYHTKES